MPDFLNVNDVLSNLHIKDDMMAAEFGCGSADFAIALSRKIPQGRVYALDVQEEKLSALKGKASMAKIQNIHTILADLENPKGSTLQDKSLDVVLIPNVLFQAENKYAMIDEGARILKSGGQLLIVDWLKLAPFSPKVLVLPEEMKKMAEQIGLEFVKEFSVGDYHYGIIFKKP